MSPGRRDPQTGRLETIKLKLQKATSGFAPRCPGSALFKVDVRIDAYRETGYRPAAVRSKDLTNKTTKRARQENKARRPRNQPSSRYVQPPNSNEPMH